MKKFLKRFKHLEKIKGLIIFIVIIILWKICTEIRIWSSFILPPPERVLETFVNEVEDGTLFIDIISSMRRVLIGFGVSAVLGIPLGIFFGIHKNTYAYFKSLIDFLRNTPPLALIPMLILWFGIGEKSKIIVIILASFFPIFTSTLKGIRNCDSKLIEVGEIFELSQREIIFKIIIPSSLLDIAVGLKLALGYSFRAIIGAELIAASSGLGSMISDGKEMSRTDIVIVGIIVIGALGIFVDWIFSKLVNKVAKGKEDETYD
ncbi:MAG: ABC transporter permease [Clostridioides sp.]|jgi:sulfonate transport system permease protein|nr:ABC transporter permease [Clostridioides sp.]